MDPEAKRRKAASMRRNPTLAERRLWSELRHNRGGYSVWRQHIIRGWIADFYLPAARLVTEVDGESHIGREAHDRLRDEVMAAYGLKVLRFSNAHVLADAKAIVEHVVCSADARGGRARQQSMDRAERRREAAAAAALDHASQPVQAVAVIDRAARATSPLQAFRCAWCLRDWAQRANESAHCHRCKVSRVDPVCLTCRRRTPQRGRAHCSTCADARAIAREEFGNPHSELGARHHRARKFRFTW